MSKVYVQVTTRHYFNSEEERRDWLENSCPYTLTTLEKDDLLNGEAIERSNEVEAREAIAAVGQEGDDDYQPEVPAVEAQDATETTTFELKKVHD